MKSPQIDIFAAVAEACSRTDLRILVIGGHAVNAYSYIRTTVDADFLIRSGDLAAWRAEFEGYGWRWSGQTETFVKFVPPMTEPPSLPVDVMLVSDATFEKLEAEHRELEFGLTRLGVPKPLHMIALKLHAMKNEERWRSGKDMSDILQIIRLGGIDPAGVEFQSVLEHYANQATRDLLAAALRSG